MAKKLIFAVVPLFAALLLLEIVGRCVHYQRYGDAPLSIIGMTDALFEWRLDLEIEQAAERFVERTQGGIDTPWQEWELRYAEIFPHFVQAVRDADAKLVMMFVPAPDNSTVWSREYFIDLAAEFEIPFLDLTHELGQHSLDLTHLIPEDGHLSRFGNFVTAGTLLGFLEPMLEHRTSSSYASRPELLGDLEASDNYIFWKGADLPCRVITNAQGLRRMEDLEFPRPDRPRILCVGDSYTFGASVHNPHAYPQLLERLAPHLEVVNAGTPGYTICDELSYFRERGRFVEPDIVVLQVFSNDILGFEQGLLETFCRGGEFCPTRGERR